MLVAFGFALAIAATSGNVTARNTDDSDGGGGCEGTGLCGKTPNGTILYGKWVEK